MDVRFQKQLIELSLKTAEAEKARGSIGLYEIFKAQADRIQAELDKYLSTLPKCKKKTSKRRKKRVQKR